MSDPLYQSAIIDHTRAPRHAGRLRAMAASATRDNPLCGDRVTFDLRLGPDGTIDAIAQSVRGCALCQAAASMLAETLLGRRPDAAQALQLQVAAMLTGGAPAPAPFDVFAAVAQVPSRRFCVLLPFETVAAVPA